MHWLEAAIARVLNATWQRCLVHFIRNLLAHAGRSGRTLAAAFIGTLFAQQDKAAAKTQWRKVTDQMRASVPKLAAFMDDAEEDVLAYMDFPPAHWVKRHSTNPIGHPNGEIKRRTNVVGIVPNQEPITRLIGAILMEEWAVKQARYMTLETIASMSNPQIASLARDRENDLVATLRPGTRSAAPLCGPSCG